LSSQDLAGTTAHISGFCGYCGACRRIWWVLRRMPKDSVGATAHVEGFHGCHSPCLMILWVPRRMSRGFMGATAQVSGFHGCHGACPRVSWVPRRMSRGFMGATAQMEDSVGAVAHRQRNRHRQEEGDNACDFDQATVGDVGRARGEASRNEELADQIPWSDCHPRLGGDAYALKGGMFSPAREGHLDQSRIQELA
jgi:hypothetical protein